MRPRCGRRWCVPAVAHPLKASCGRCSPLLAASNTRIALALLSQVHQKPALAPSPTARPVTNRRQPLSRSLRTQFQSPRTRVRWRRCERRLWRSAGPLFANFPRDGDCRGAGGVRKSGYSRARHPADTLKHRHGSGRRIRGGVKADAVVCRHRALARDTRNDCGRVFDRGGLVFRSRWWHQAPPHEGHGGSGSAGDRMKVTGSVAAPVSRKVRRRWRRSRTCDSRRRPSAAPRPRPRSTRRRGREQRLWVI